MAKHRVRVGLHGRNDVHFRDYDYTMVNLAHIETMKMMSFTDVSVYERLRRENQGIEFIVRLYDDRLRRDSRPSPSDFVTKMVPIIKRLKPYATKFEIHNEPNHASGIEGWGSSDDNARAFLDWYMKVLPALKRACPWAQFGFPGLALNHPHRDLEWLDICRDGIRASDWLGCHCYWQYGNMLKDQWGLRFKLYHPHFPNKRIEITEFGNSTPNSSREKVATEYAQFYQALNKYPYLGSASAFIASSPDPNWALFVWAKEGGEMLPVVRAVRDTARTAVEVPPPKPPTPKPPAKPPAQRERTFPQTGQTVRGSFLKFLDQYGLDICGYPITGQIKEAGRPAQYFQRVGLVESGLGKIELKLVGTEAWTSRKKIEALQDEIKRLLQHLPTQPPVTRPTAIGQPAIQDVVDKLVRHEDKRYDTRSRGAIKALVIHHSAVPPTVTPQRIADYHVRRLDWPAVGYHFVVAADGVIYQTNTVETVSYHVASFNTRSVGICFLGSFSSEVPPADQLQAGAHLVAWLMQELDVPLDEVKGHKELMATACPGMQWLEGQGWKQMLRQEIARAQQDASQSSAVTPSGPSPNEW